jgi:hypothetical protein
MVEMLREADANGDGKIERSELPERMARAFDRLDTNGDGVIDQDEIKALAERAGGGPPAAEEPGEEPPAEERGAEPPAEAEPAEAEAPETEAAEAEAPAAAAAPPGEDPVSGTWTGRVSNEQMPPDQGGFTLMLKLGPDGKAVTGELRSQFNEGEIEPGSFEAESGRLSFVFVGDQMELTFSGTVRESSMRGTVDVGGGMFTMQFEAERTSAGTGEAGDEAAAPRGQLIAELVPDPRWVSSLEASRFEAGRVYITFDGHRSDDDEPHVLASEDYGRSWRSIRGNLPTEAGSTRVVREDLTNPDILYLGCEFSAWVSIDRGTTWTKLNSNLPTVAVHEIAQHATTGEIVAGTHGRSLWVLDVTPLRRIAGAEDDATLFRPRTAHYWQSTASRGGDLRRFVGENPPDGAQIYYLLKRGADDISLRIMTPEGRLVRQLEADGSAGLHRVEWDLRRERPRDRGQAARGGRGGFRGRFGPRVEPGTYHVVLQIGEEEYRQPVSVEGDPEFPEAVLWGEAYDEMLDVMGMFEED